MDMLELLRTVLMDLIPKPTSRKTNLKACMKEKLRMEFHMALEECSFVISYSTPQSKKIWDSQRPMLINNATLTSESDTLKMVILTAK